MMVFDRALTASEIYAIYNAAIAPAVELEIVKSGNSPILSWPTGVLQQADEAAGQSGWLYRGNEREPVARAASSQVDLYRGVAAALGSADPQRALPVRGRRDFDAGREVKAQRERRRSLAGLARRQQHVLGALAGVARPGQGGPGGPEVGRDAGLPARRALPRAKFHQRL